MKTSNNAIRHTLLVMLVAAGVCIPLLGIGGVPGTDATQCPAPCNWARVAPCPGGTFTCCLTVDGGEDDEDYHLCLC